MSLCVCLSQGGLPEPEAVLSSRDRQGAAQTADRQFGARDRPAQVRVCVCVCVCVMFICLCEDIFSAESPL